MNNFRIILLMIYKIRNLPHPTIKTRHFSREGKNGTFLSIWSSSSIDRSCRLLLVLRGLVKMSALNRWFKFPYV
jgi:hypothetical protein